MRKRLLFLVVSFLFMGQMATAQEVGASDNLTPEKTKTSSYNRGSGFVMRPELYGGFFFNAGYQINPYIQVTGGVGITIDPTFVIHAGARAYTSPNRWAAMFDYHIGTIVGYGLWRNSIVAGAAYKDLDFGVGLQYISGNAYGQHIANAGLLITVGWNIRCYPHR